jgi:hypothetical protein
MEEIQRSLQDLLIKVTYISDEQQVLNTKIKDIELSKQLDKGIVENLQKQQQLQGDSQSQDPRLGVTDSLSQLTGASAGGVASGLQNLDIQSEFVAIKDTLVKVKLPGDYKVPDTKTGIKAQFSHQATVIQRCAKYAETATKIVQLLGASDNPVTKEDLHDLDIVNIAQIKFLQEEFASIIVESKYGQDTAQTFRSLQRNLSVLPPEVIEKVEMAINLSVPANRSDNYRGRGYNDYRYNFRPRGRGRGGFRGGRGRSNYNNSYGNNFNSGYDPYSQYSYNTIPDQDMSRNG